MVLSSVSDQRLGSTLLAAIASTFVYYTVWAILLPFFDSGSPIHAWFPSREWAVRIPAFILVVGMSSVALLVGFKVVGKDQTKCR